jgi:hypothetical protein
VSRGREKLVTEQSIAPRWRWTALPAANASVPPPPPSRRPSVNTRERRERKPRATSWRIRRLVTTLCRVNGPRDLRPKCLRHREASARLREARRRRALHFSGALRFPSGQPTHGKPMVNTASFPSGGALVVHGARGPWFAGEARAKNTIRVGYSYTISFFSPSIR